MGIELGNKVRDQASGIIGIAVSRLEHLNGCVQYGVQPQCRESHIRPEIQYIDGHQLQVYLEGGITIAREETGGLTTNALPR